MPQQVRTTRRKADGRALRQSTRTPRIRTSHASRCNPSTDVLTLAPASALSLPSLAGVPLTYTKRADTGILVPVAEYMICKELATAADWTGDVSKFVQAGLDAIIDASRIKSFTEDVPTLHATLADHEGYYSRGDSLHALRIGIGSSDCGYFRMGAITRNLERTAKGLGAAFYAAVVSALDTFGWTFDYCRAKYDCDSYREMIEDENGKPWADMTKAEREQYEVRDPDKDVPTHLKRVKTGEFNAAHRKLLTAHRAKHPKLLSLALQMADHAAHLRAHGKTEYPEGDSPATYLIFFEDYDTITACFDDWAANFLEGDVTYCWQRTFDPARPTELRNALGAFECAVRLMAAAAELAPMVNRVTK